MGVFEHFPYTNFHDMNDAWVLKTVKECAAAVIDMEEWKSQHQEEYQELKEFMDKINSGELPDTVYEELRTWIETNAIDIIGDLVKSVYFGITDDGYFVAYIPESWSDIIFNTTGLDINLPIQPEYGHLVLSY
jgi:hypothetical protein